MADGWQEWSGGSSQAPGSTGCVIPHFSVSRDATGAPSRGSCPAWEVQDHPAQPMLLKLLHQSIPCSKIPANSSSTKCGASEGSVYLLQRMGASPSHGEVILHSFNPGLPSTTSLFCAVLTVPALPPCIRQILVIQPVVN